MHRLDATPSGVSSMDILQERINVLRFHDMKAQGTQSGDDIAPNHCRPLTPGRHAVLRFYKGKILCKEFRYSPITARTMRWTG